MMRYYADFSAPVDITRFDNADSIAENAIESGVTTIVDLAGAIAIGGSAGIGAATVRQLAAAGMEVHFLESFNRICNQRIVEHGIFDLVPYVGRRPVVEISVQLILTQVSLGVKNAIEYIFCH